MALKIEKYSPEISSSYEELPFIPPKITNIQTGHRPLLGRTILLQKTKISLSWCVPFSSLRIPVSLFIYLPTENMLCNPEFVGIFFTLLLQSNTFKFSKI